MQEELQNQEQPVEGQAIGQQEQSTYNDILNAQKITMKDVSEHLTGPVVSLIAHIVLITCALTFFSVGGGEKTKEIEVTLQELEIKEFEKPPEPPPPDDVVINDQETISDSAQVAVDRPDVASTNVDVKVDDVAVGAGPATDVVMPNVLSVKPSSSSLVLPGIMAMRSGGGRKAAIKAYGGSSRTELGVQKGLRWLKDHQNDDGSWGEGHKNAFSGLALLTFLAHGETPSSAEFGPCVLKGIKYLCEVVEKSTGCIGNCSYTHGIVTYALSEAYALTKIPMLEPLVNKAVAVIIKGQNNIGCFNYAYNNAEQRSDLSVSGWNMQALKAAFAAGATEPGIEAAIEKAIKGTSGPMHQAGQGFAYDNGGGATKAQSSGPQMTAVGTLCLQLLGAGKMQEVKEGIAWMEKNINTMSWKESKGWDLYRWYYQTQAYFQFYEGKEKQWKDWNKMFTNELLKNQKPDGRWDTPAIDALAGAAPGAAAGPEAFKGIDGPVYGTSLSCLMLEVYYRYLPTFKVAEAKPGLVGSAPAAAPAAGAAAAAPAPAEKKKDDGGLIIE